MTSTKRITAAFFLCYVGSEEATISLLTITTEPLMSADISCIWSTCSFSPECILNFFLV
jgi:hypothetical protein